MGSKVNDLGRLADATGLSSAAPIEPVPVSPVPASIPSATPEQDELFRRWETKGLINFHIDAVPGSTPEQIAGEINRVDRWLENPINAMSSRLRGEAMMQHDTAHQSFQILEDGTSAPLPITGRQKSAKQLGDLLVKAAEMLEGFAASGMQLREDERSETEGEALQPGPQGTPNPTPDPNPPHAKGGL